MDAQSAVALRGLADSYAFACDRRDGDRLAALFAPDALLVVHWPGRTAREYRAPDEVREIPTGLTRYDRTFHFVGNHLVSELSGDTARGDTYCEAHHVTGGSDHVLAIHYEDRYVRSGESWRFGRRDVRIQWSSTAEVR